MVAPVRPHVQKLIPVVQLGRLPQTYAGVSVYRGVIVCWDADYDLRVLGVIDQLPASVRRRLVSIAECKGSVAMQWLGPPPEEFETHSMLDVWEWDGTYNDAWHIWRSESIGAEDHRRDVEPWGEIE